jgi:hypothetical protein
MTQTLAQDRFLFEAAAAAVGKHASVHARGVLAISLGGAAGHGGSLLALARGHKWLMRCAGMMAWLPAAVCSFGLPPSPVSRSAERC